MKLRSAFAQAAVAVATPFGRLCDIFSGVFKHEWRNHSVKKSLVLLTLGFCISLAAFAQQAAKNDFDGKTWWDYVKVLADDNMEGRETGSAGLKRAEAYVVEQLKADGVEPAGSDGYYQPVKFEVRQIVEKDSSIALIRDGKSEPLALGEDAFFNTRVNLAPEIEAPLVFVGYGLTIPEKNYDDLAGLDLKGKVVAIFGGSPAEMPGALASHYQSPGERWKSLRKAGVLGVVTLPNPASMDIPWSRMSLNRAHPSMELADATLNETEGEKLSMIVNPASAEKLFAGSGHTFAEIAELGKDRKPLPRFPLAVSIKAVTKVDTTEVESANVIGKLPGSDPALKNEYVVLSAHIDHLGIGEPINGDKIYNGAMDNGSGSALLLDVARSLKADPAAHKRSILFVFVCGEEKGLLGSKYFAAHSTVPAKSIVADINTDMFLPLIPLKVLTVYGLQESDLGDIVREVAEAQGVKVQPDPEPLRNSFIRSDQYSFIRHGIPALAMKVGYEQGSPDAKLYKDWLTQRYHAPSDDTNQPVDLQSAAAFEAIVRGLTIAVANRTERPQWKSDSFFRRFAQAD
ncbi:MAG TPA: M28 family metallopeptidase [Candidatus Dormibacteraeota bacterium]|nr:M28 family metallopeptidase [Candidatus Dormibacteraeota bacterium]